MAKSFLECLAEQEHGKVRAKSFLECLAKYNHNHDAHGRFASSNSALPNPAINDTIESVSATIEGGGERVSQVHTVGRIDLDIFRCVTPDITTDEVIITDERIQHIRDRHPLDYERYHEYLFAMVSEPDYILETEAEKTAFILKEFATDEKRFRLVLRLNTATDAPGYKNSVITYQYVSKKEYRRLIRNKTVLYTRFET